MGGRLVGAVVVVGIAGLGAAAWAQHDAAAPSPVTFPYDETSCENPLPPMVLRGDSGKTVELSGAFTPAPKSGSFSSVACDYGAPANVDDLGESNGFDVELATTWTVEASYDFGPCGISRPAVVTKTAPGRFHVDPAGPAGGYVVTLRTRGPEGSAYGYVGIRTSASGPEPAPTTDAGTYSSDELRSFGFTLVLVDVAPTTFGRAQLTVTGDDGEHVTVPLQARSDTTSPVCRHDLQVAKADEPAVKAVKDTPLTFRYEVELDGQMYVSTATYPEDLDEDTTSFHPKFTPPLPAL